MKTITELKQIINENRAKKAELEKQYQKLNTEIIEKFSYNKRCENYNNDNFHKEFKQNIEKENEIQDKIKDCTIKNVILQNNLKVVKYNTLYPMIYNIMIKYQNKRMGDKTREKLKAELKEKTGYYIYFDADSITISAENYDYNSRVEIYSKKYNNKFIDSNNKLNLIEFENTFINHNCYINDIDNTIINMKKELQEMKIKYNELKNSINEYNHKYNIEHLNNLYIDSIDFNIMK